MDSTVSAHEPDTEQQQSPRRLSALYQYHNAPEVAPAHGIEYDDTIYPHSDKMTIVREFPFRHHNSGAKHRFDSDNRPPRIIFGMKVRTFLVVASVVLLVVIGAAVGGAVGGKNLRQGSPPQPASYPSSPSSSRPKPTTTTSTFSAPVPTYTALSDCPASNGTVYTSPFSETSLKTVTGVLGKQNFTKYCDMTVTQAIQKITGAFVYSFSDCADMCASFNFANDTSACNVATYHPEAPRPVNCWIGATQPIIGPLQMEKGTDVALLVPPGL